MGSHEIIDIYLRRILSIILLLIVLLPVATAQVTGNNVRLHGRALQYASHHIEVFVYKDYITRDKVAIGVIDIDDNGKFDCVVDLQREGVRYAFLELGAYKAYIYLESGKTYQIVLPPFKQRPDADRFNPFYQQELIEIGIVNEASKLNISIRGFESWWHNMYAENISRLARYNDRKLADKLILQCDSIEKVINCSSQFFHDFVHYRKAQVYATPRMGDVRRVLSSYYASNKPSNIDVPSYWQTLNMVCPNFLSSITIYTEAKEKCRKELRSNDGTFYSLSKALSTDTVYANKIVREHLMLMGIYDGYYAQDISESYVDNMLSGALKQGATEEVKLLAQNIVDKKSYLHSGTEAPDFTLMDMNGKDVTLSKLKGRWVYLGFLHSENFAAVKDMAALDALQAKYQKDMLVIGVFTDEKSDRLAKKLKAAKHQWMPLTYISQQSVLSDYNVVALPTYYLIDPEGRIKLSPAPSPTEKIEQAIATQMVSYKSEISKRGKNNQVKNIYDIAH